MGSDRDCKQGLSVGSDRDCEAGAVYGVWGQTGTVKQGLSMGCGVRQGL